MKKKWLNKNVAAFGFSSLFSDMSHEMATSILPLFLSVELGMAAFFLGIIEGVSDLLSNFAKIFSGWYSDKLRKRKPFILSGYALTGVFIPAIGFAANWIHVLLARTIGWIGRGIRGPPRDALLSDSVNKKYRSRAFGFERMMDTIGAIIGPAIAFFFLPLIGFRNIFFLSLVPGIIAVFFILFFVKDKQKKPKKKMKFGKTLHKMPRNFRIFLLAAAIFGIANFANTFLVLRVIESLKPNMGELAAGGIGAGLYVMLNIGAAAFAYIFGSLGDKTSKKKLIILGYMIFSIYCIGFIFLEPTIINFILLFLLAGVETGLIDVMERAYTADIVNSKIRGTAYGLLNTVNGIGDFASSTTAGILWTVFGFSMAFGYGAVLSLFAATMLFISKTG